MFSEQAKKLQERYGSRTQYERMASFGVGEQELGFAETEFIAARDSFYIATVTPDGWPYMQHRGGPKGFLRVLDAKTVAFADVSGNKQYITAGNLAANDRVALFLMDYPNRTRFKLIGHATLVDGGADPALEARVKLAGQRGRIERIFLIEVVGFDWNCSQNITPRYTREEMMELSSPRAAR
jgi:predicted pyridoxine 5'-phosphate oxidase superfamily flavin-nucleotide-binding protein